MGPALRPGLGFRPEYFFSGGSIDNNHIAVEKQASASDRRSHNFVGAVLVLNLVSILRGSVKRAPCGLNGRLPDAHVTAAVFSGATVDMPEVLLRTRAKAA